MTWFHKAKQQRTFRPALCQRCHGRAPTQEIEILWQAEEAVASTEPRNWWLCDECAGELRRGERPGS